MKKLYFNSILVLFTLIGFAIPGVKAQTRQLDSLALVYLYNNTGGANWTTKTNWLSTTQPINTWYGVTVTNNRLSALNLSSNHLVGGPIPVGLVVDSALATLNLSNNAITGTLPFFSDTSMLTLNLSGNQLSGTLNYYLLKNLQSIDLSNNLFTGGIGSLSSYPKLVSLNAARNQFTGGIPYLSDTNMVYLNVDSNQLSGTINYYNLPKLQTLIISRNQLTGATASLSSYSKAVTVNASYNQFTGTAPYFGGNNNLVTVNLSNNSLTGSLPYFSNTALQTIDFSNNQLTGTVGYYNAPALVNLRVDHNLLSGGLNFQMPATLKVFTGNANKFTGAIVPPLTGLTTLKLDSNKYTFAVLQPLIVLPATVYTYNNQDTLLPLNYNTFISGKFSVTAGGTLDTNTYKWYKNGTLVATIPHDSTYTPTANGLYRVVVTNVVCPLLSISSDTLSIRSFPDTTGGGGVGVPVINGGRDFTVDVFPNPVINNGTVQINTPKERIVNMRLIDVRGAVLYAESKKYLQRGINTLPIALEEYASGIYIVEISEVNSTPVFMRVTKY